MKKAIGLLLMALTIFSLAAQTADLGSLAANLSKEYVVVKGDTLRGIAAKELGEYSLWPAVWFANSDAVSIPDVIEPGTSLKIYKLPADASAPAKVESAVVKAAYVKAYERYVELGDEWKPQRRWTLLEVKTYDENAYSYDTGWIVEEDAAWLGERGVEVAAVSGASEEAAAQSATYKITILSTNDTHGQPLPFAFSGAVAPGGIAWNSPVAGGLAARKTFVDKVKAENPDTVVLDGGDVNTGNIVSNLNHAKADFLAMSLVGYDAMVLGNHEFDVSQEAMQERRADATFPLLSANIYVKATGQRLVDPYAIIDLPGGAKVGVIGVTPLDTPTLVMPDNVADLEFRDPVEELKTLVPEVEAKADLVVVLSHLGLAVDEDLALEVPGIDVIIGGHSHTYMPSEEYVAGVPIFQAYTGGAFVGRMDLTVTDGAVVASKAEPVPINLAVLLKEGEAPKGVMKEIGGKKYDFIPTYLEPNPEVEAVLKPFADQVAAEMGVVIAQAAGEFPHTINGLNNYPRRDDMALANMLCDAMREATSLKIGREVDVFLQNGGGIRAPIAAGPVTKKTIYTVLPFDNTIMTAEITGAQIMAMLEKKVLPVAVLNYGDKYSGPDGSFLQVSGMTYTLDLAAKTVSDVMVGGQPLDPAKTYLIGTQNFMMAGGDGYTMLKDAANPYSTSVYQRDMVIDWLVAKGDIDPAAYNDNRINLLNTGH